MPLPLIVAGVAIAAGATGLVTGAKGTKKISDAKNRVKQADEKYQAAKQKLEDKDTSTNISLDKLGLLKVQIWRDFDRFQNAFEKIQNRPEFENKSSDKFTLPKHALHAIQEIQIKAVEILGTSIASAGAGALTGMAAYSGVLALGTASTGTAISTLSGVAATNAALAALGGGSLAAGGGGIALGTQILGGAVAGPVIAVGGLLLNAKGNSSLEKADKAEQEVDKIVKTIDESCKYMTNLSNLSFRLRKELMATQEVYLKQVGLLEDLVLNKADYNYYTLEEKVIVDNNIKMVGILYKLATQSLLSQSKEENKQPELLEDDVNRLIEDTKAERLSFK